MLLTFFIGKRLYSSRTGFLSGLVLATSAEFAYLSTRGNIDATLTFFTTASIHCFLRWYQSGPEAREFPNQDEGPLFYGYYIGMALATLTQGNRWIYPPLIRDAPFSLGLQKDWKGIREMKLLTGVLLFLAIVLAWYSPCRFKGGTEYLDLTLFATIRSPIFKDAPSLSPSLTTFTIFPPILPWITLLPFGHGLCLFTSEMSKKRKEFFFSHSDLMSSSSFSLCPKGERHSFFFPSSRLPR